MKYIKLIILGISLSTLFTGCSYVSDMAEAELTTRASFSAKAEFIPPNSVKITWDETDSSENFAGIEIYRTDEPNREFTDYELVASQYIPNLPISGDLSSGSTTTCTVSVNKPYPALSGETYFYRVGLIHMEEDDDTDTHYPFNEGNYNLYTFIDEISGYAKVVIP